MKHKTPPKTAREVRDEFIAAGQSIAGWSRANKTSPRLVYAILSEASSRRCLRGESHRIAVLLGLKRGSLAGFDQPSRQD